MTVGLYVHAFPGLPARSMPSIINLSHFERAKCEAPRRIKRKFVAPKYHVMAALPSISVEKTTRRSQQLQGRRTKWPERDVVKRICFSFSFCSLVFKLHEFKVAPFWKITTHLQDSKFQKIGPKFTTLGEIPFDTYD